MWLIDEDKKQMLNTKTGMVIINKAEIDTLRIVSGITQIDLTLEEGMLNIIPSYRLCQIFDSLNECKSMDIEQVEEYINDELINFIEGMDNERV